MQKQLEELKAAVEKDLNNPKTLEIITYAASEKESLTNKRENSFHSETSKKGKKTPRAERQGNHNPFFGSKNDFNVQNY